MSVSDLCADYDAATVELLKRSALFDLYAARHRATNSSARNAQHVHADRAMAMAVHAPCERNNWPNGEISKRPNIEFDMQSGVCGFDL